MPRYELIAHTAAGQPHGRPVFVTAHSAGEAVMLGAPTVRRVAERDRSHPELYAVYQHRRIRGRRLVGSFAPDGPDDGLAGVREPRRPLPAPPSLRVEADPPAYRNN